MKRATLARQNAWLLLGAFLLVEMITALAFAWFLMLPMARRSADDLAGLMILAAQTWAELPPATRPAFEHELMAHHRLALRAEPAGPGRDEWHPPFFYLLEEALARRTGTVRHLAAETIGETLWYWTDIPVGAGFLAVGVPRSRIASEPFLALFFALGSGFLLATGLASGLARRIATPLARFEAAAAHIGLGEVPALLPESGPQELASLARRFNLLAQQVRALLAARTTMLAGISHDLRTPLARLRLALEMLKSDPSASLIERIERDIEEMDGLIADLLELARGLQREPLVATDLAAVLDDLAHRARATGRTIVVRCPPGRRLLAKRALRRALGNLLDNALRHAPGGPIELVGEFLPAGCRCAVMDRGPGIPPEKIPAMFEPFQRLEDSRSPQTGGAGLGLAIVRELARANGWQVALQPRPGGGLMAWIEVLEAMPADEAMRDKSK